MTEPIFAAAQCRAVAGDLAANVARHLRFMQAAHREGVRFLLFPELSLTGYEPQLAASLMQAPESAVLAPLREYAREAGMTAVAGLPLDAGDGGKPVLAAVVLHGDGSVGVHAKQHLHAGEEQHFRAGAGGPLLRIGAVPVALSICADFTRPAHPAAAAQAGAALYASSVLISERGYPVDSELLQGHAHRHRMAVLMANHGGETGGWSSAGRSACWDESGALVAATPGPGAYLLAVTRSQGGWQGRVLPVE